MCQPMHGGTCGVTRAMRHHLEGEATSPEAQHQSIPAKGRKSGQHSTEDVSYSQMDEPWCMEMQGVRSDKFKMKGIRTRSREDWPLSGVQ